MQNIHYSTYPLTRDISKIQTRLLASKIEELSKEQETATIFDFGFSRLSYKSWK